MLAIIFSRPRCIICIEISDLSIVASSKQNFKQPMNAAWRMTEVFFLYYTCTVVQNLLVCCISCAWDAQAVSNMLLFLKRILQAVQFSCWLVDAVQNKWLISVFYSTILRRLLHAVNSGQKYWLISRQLGSNDFSLKGPFNENGLPKHTHMQAHTHAHTLHTHVCIKNNIAKSK